MEFQDWMYWVMGAFIFFVLEIFIPGFIMGSIGLGCLFAAGGALLQLPLWFNIILGITGFFLGIAMLKPILKKLGKPSTIKTNAEGLIGRTGTVTEKIDPESGFGRVRIDGDDWKAISENGHAIEKGCIVETVALESIVVTVRKLNRNGSVQETEKPKVAETLKEHKGLIISLGNKKELIYHKEIIGFFSTQKITYMIHFSGKQVIIDESLEKLEEQLDSKLFFRANRQFILTAQMIREYKPDDGGGITVFLKQQPNLPEFISVSRLKAHAFRKWIEKQFSY
jgi:membrane protein implicated in regulation of membrane protease activity